MKAIHYFLWLLILSGNVLADIKYINPGESIQVVIDSITDASENNPYTLLLSTGLHQNTTSKIILKSYIHLKGDGPGSTILQTSGNNNIIAADYSSISNLTIRHDGNTNSAAVTERSDLRGGFELNNVHFDINGANKAFFTKYANPLYIFRNCKIVTEGIGLHFQASYANAYLHGIDITLVGNEATAPHIGILVDGDGGTQSTRIYYWGGKIGTGYGWPEVTGGGIQTVVGVYVTGSASGARIELHDLESFTRLENATAGAKVNVLRGETGWIRCFSCFGQSETPPDWGIGTSIYQTGDAKIELVGGSNRLSGGAKIGNTYGASQLGISTFSATDHMLLLDKFQGGLILCDASEGPFTLLVSNSNYGTPHIFIKADSSNNPITIKTIGIDTINGNNSRTLNQQYQKLRIVRHENNWYEY